MKDEKKQDAGSSFVLHPSSFRIRRWAVAVTAVLLLLVGLGITEATGVTNVRGTITRLFSPENTPVAEVKNPTSGIKDNDPKGILVLEIDDPGVSVKVDGDDRVVTGVGTREIQLKPGQYTVETQKDGKVVRRDPVTISKNERQIVRVSWERPPGVDHDRRAAEYVLSIGGRVKVNDEDQDITAAADLPQGPFRLTMVELSQNKQVTDAGLAVFKDCKNLTRLSLWQTNVGDEGLVHVKDCKAVTHLWLGSTRVTDAGMAHLDGRTNLVLLDLLATNVTDVGLGYLKGCRGMDNLSLCNTGVTDAGLAHIKDFKSMRNLFLNSTQVTDAGLTRLAGLDRLGFLGLTQAPQVTAKGVASLAKSLPQCIIDWDGGKIQPTANVDFDRRAAEYVLSIGGAVRIDDGGRDINTAADLPKGELRLTHVGLIINKKVTDEGLAVLKDCKNLKVLDLVGTPVTDAALGHAKNSMNLTSLYVAFTEVGDAGLTHLKDCKNLTDINLNGSRVTNAGLAVMKDWKNLSVLNLADTQVTDAGLAVLKDYTSLTELYLNDTQVTDAGLKHLARLAGLTRVTLLKTQVTPKGVEEFAKALPKCKIEWDGGVIEPR